MGILDSILGKTETVPEEAGRLEALKKEIADATGEIFVPFGGFGQKGYATADQTVAIFMRMPNLMPRHGYEKEPGLLSKRIGSEDYLGKEGCWYRKKWFDLQIRSRFIPKDCGPAVLEMKNGGFLMLAPRIE